jgi:organic hydroperoxide reductase OsmC/OhrA
MSEHRVNLTWTRGGRDFTYESYSRDHTWSFEGGATVGASAAPGYKGNPELVDPEQAFVASLSSCHMLTFLALAAKNRLVVDRYVDNATGVMEKNEQGRMAVTRVVLRPEIEFEGDVPDPAKLVELHDKAHHHCFIANSVKTDITVEQVEPKAV